MDVQEVGINSIHPYDKNPRVNKKSIDIVARSLKEFGWNQPIVIDTNKIIICGHTRFAAAQKLGMRKVPVLIADHLSAAQVQAYRIADNKSAEKSEWDISMLLEEIEALRVSEFDTLQTGFTSKEIANLEKKLSHVDTPDEHWDDVDEDIGGAFALKANMVFDSDEPFNIPMLDATMCCAMPEPITCWAGPDASDIKSPHHFYNVNTDSVRGLDFTKTVIGFYTDDERFESFWTRPDAATGKLLNRNPYAVLSPNYSMWFHMPKAQKIWNTYRSRWVGKYFQEAGLKVIPDVNFSDPSTLRFRYAGIPKNLPCVSIQLQTAKKVDEEVAAKAEAIRDMIQTLKPQSLFVYHCGVRIDEC